MENLTGEQQVLSEIVQQVIKMALKVKEFKWHTQPEIIPWPGQYTVQYYLMHVHSLSPGQW